MAVGLTRSVMEFFGFILVPVCIEKEAARGQWQIKITTERPEAQPPVVEMIESVCEVM